MSCVLPLSCPSRSSPTLHPLQAQEPGTDSEIAEFCQVNYGVTFPLATKSDVNGPETSPVYKYLKEKKNVDKISWNFDKFVVGRDGEVKEYFDR